MSENDSGQYSWCSFQARQDQSIILEYIVLASQIAIFALMIYAYVRAKRQNRVNQLSAVYKLIIAWLICKLIYYSRLLSQNFNQHCRIFRVHGLEPFESVTQWPKLRTINRFPGTSHHVLDISVFGCCDYFCTSNHHDLHTLFMVLLL